MEQNIIQTLIRYNPQTGLLFWKPRDASLFNGINPSKSCKTWNTKYANKEITSTDGPGYIVVHINLGKRTRIGGHRIAWLLYHGVWPDTIDHINGNITDNRICNLRSCTQSENNRNRCVSSKNTSGKVGVTFYKRTQQWRAWFKLEGKEISLGYHDSKDAAIAARVAAEKMYGFCERQISSEPRRYEQECGPAS